MSSNATLKDVGMAAYYLQTIEKYQQQFEKNPGSFTLRCNMNDEIVEIPLNDIMKKEIAAYFEEKRKLNQKILDDNPEIVEYLEKI